MTPGAFVSCLVIFLGTATNAFASSWLDRSNSIFFPPDLRQEVIAQQSYPAFWWNFVIANPAQGTRLCKTLKSDFQSILSRVECGFNLREIAPIVEEWSYDLPLRHPRPSDVELRSHLDRALGKATLPGVDRSVLELVRHDPLESWKELKAVIEERLGFSLLRRNEDSRIVIPIQFRTPPLKTTVTAQVVQGLDTAAIFVGPHAASYENEREIIRDLNRVSIVASTMLIFFGLLLFRLRCARLLFLIPPILASVGLSSILVVKWFGSIHGLTISFGTGIVGMALDYGLHAGFSPSSRSIWKSNVVGLFTTLVGLLLLSFSSIPLIRQMMMFSIFGLSFSFIAIYFLSRRSPNLFAAIPVIQRPKLTRWKVGVVILFLLASIVGLFTSKPMLDLSRFDFQSPRSKEAQQWLTQTFSIKPPLIRIHESRDVWKEVSQERLWGTQNGIVVDNLERYLPEPATQKKNLLTWTSHPCEKIKSSLTPSEIKFFEPFLSKILCSSEFSILDGETSRGRQYLSHLYAEGTWLSMFLPKTIEDENKVKQRFSDAQSLRELFSEFPKILSNELRWMAPLSLLLAFGIILFHYRKWSLACLSLIPLFSGLGCYFIGMWLFNLEFSFVSVIALIMVFGASIDYGIFTVDLRNLENEKLARGIWSALTFSAITTAAGFVPMLFCHHPVLKDFGIALCLGTLGAFLGALWGTPVLMKTIQK